MDTILSVISRYLSGSASGEDLKELSEWLEASEDNRKLFAGLSVNMSVHSNATSEDAEERREKMLSRLNARIDSSEVKKRNNILRWFAAVAAAAAAAAVVFLSRPEPTPVPADTIIANTSATTRLYTLPDGTRVCLKPESTIAYNVTGATGRHIRIDGSGFFDVAKDSLRPMTVMTKDVYLKVLGTSFSINSKTGYQDTEIILETGSVRLTTPSGAPLICLSPDQKAVFRSATSDLTVEAIAAAPYVVSNYSIVSLSNATVSEILSAIGTTFNTTVSISGSPDNKRYNFNFLKSDDPSDVVRVLELLTGRECSMVSGK